MLVSFTSDTAPYVHQLKYYIAEYRMDGTMVGDIRTLENELMLCSSTKDDGRLMSMFGTNYDKK